MENDSKLLCCSAGTAIATNVDVSITDFEAIKVFVLLRRLK
jgi:hypothetical protein